LVRHNREFICAAAARAAEPETVLAEPQVRAVIDMSKPIERACSRIPGHY
jgi:hypothetical protein